MLIGLYYTQIDFFMGFSAGLKAFTAAVLGGIGNIRGAMLGGLLLGVIESLAVTFMDPAYKDVIAFLVLILVLTFRPEGLLGEIAGRLAEGLSMDAALRQRLAFAGLGAVALLAPLAVPNDYVMGVIARICLYALLALGLNIVVGFAGLLDIGYVAFFGIGSYVYAFLSSPHFGLHLPFLLTLPIVVAATAVSGVIIGAPTLRVRGDYLAMVTLGFGEIVYLLLVNLDRPLNITGGPSGIIGVDPPALAGLAPGSNVEYYFLFLVFLAFAVLMSVRLRDSRIGWAWRAIREDEVAAQAMGINVFVAKLQAFAIGAAFAGVAGCMLASWQRSVFPANFMFTESINILAMVILGGMGNLFGVILGAALIVALPELFREFEQYRLLAFGFMLMALMVFRPQGLLTFRGRRQALPEEAAEPVAGAVPAWPARAGDGAGSRAAARSRSPTLRSRRA